MKTINEINIRGNEREKNLGKEVYFSEGYFSLPQLFSQATQIHDINKFNPSNIIEIGLGNGFTSSFLKRAGYDVTTVDINKNLNPDICCPMNEIPSNLNNKIFDIAVCCEVLEHMPLSDFESNIKTLRSLSDQLYLTLPSYSRSYGLGGLIRLPKINKKFQLHLNLPINKKLDKEHFWEVGSEAESSKKNIINILNNYYGNVTFERYAVNPYHLSFSCRR